MFKLKTMNKQSASSNSGFSLVELSVVLVVIGVTISGALTLAINQLEGQRQKTTDERMEAIENALWLYLVENKRLPCPADPDQELGTSEMGEEGTASNGDCGPDTTYQVEGPPNRSTFDGAIHMGAVPTRSLVLPDYMMLDGWDRRIMYIVDAPFANNTSTNPNCGVSDSLCFEESAAGSIIVRNDVAPAGSETTNNAVYVLLSYGNNGRGAFTRSGIDAGGSAKGRLTDPPNTRVRERENAEPIMAGPGPNFDDTFIERATDETFDDILIYRPKWQIVDNADTITTDSICSAASEVVANPGGSATCTNASDVAICEAMATRVDELCLE